MAELEGTPAAGHGGRCGQDRPRYVRKSLRGSLRQGKGQAQCRKKKWRGALSLPRRWSKTQAAAAQPGTPKSHNPGQQRRQLVESSQHGQRRRGRDALTSGREARLFCWRRERERERASERERERERARGIELANGCFFLCERVEVHAASPPQKSREGGSPLPLSPSLSGPVPPSHARSAVDVAPPSHGRRRLE